MELKVGNKSISPWNIILFLGGLLAFIGMFIDVTTCTSTFLGVSASESFTGLDIIKDLPDGISMAVYGPVIAGVMGIILVIFSLIPLFVDLKNNAKIVNILGVILALVGLIMMVFFATQVGNGFGFVDPMFADAMKYSMSAGAYLGIVGMVLALLGTLFNLKESL